MSYVDDLRQQILTLCDQADRALDTAERIGPVIIHHLVNVNFAPILVPPGVTNWIEDRYIDLLLEVIAYGRDAVRTMRLAAYFLGSPDRLREAAERIDDVGDGAVDTSALVTVASLTAVRSSSWNDGAASETYRDSIGGRSEAVSRIAELLEPLNDALRALADGIENYYAEAAKAALGVTVAVLGIVGAIATAVETFGVGAVIGIIVAIIGAIVAFLAFEEMSRIQTQQIANSIATLTDDPVDWPVSVFGT